MIYICYFDNKEIVIDNHITMHIIMLAMLISRYVNKKTLLFLSIIIVFFINTRVNNFVETIQKIRSLKCSNKTFHKILNNKSNVSFIIHSLFKKFNIDKIIIAALINTRASRHLLKEYVNADCENKIKARHYLLVAYKHNKKYFGDILLEALLGFNRSKKKLIIIPKNIHCLSCQHKKELIEAIDYSNSLSNSIKNLKALSQKNNKINYLFNNKKFINYLIGHLNSEFKKTGNLKIIIALLLDNQTSLDWLKAYLKKNSCHYIQAKKYLYRSIFKNNIKIACKLLEAGVLLDLKLDKNLLVAYYFYNISNPNFGMLDLLFSNGLSINSTLNHQTSLIFLLKKNIENLAIINFLIDNGININAKDSNSKTAFNYALKLNNPDIIHKLAISGAYANKRDQLKLFREAIKTKNIKLFSLFGGELYQDQLYLPDSQSYVYKTYLPNSFFL